MSQKYLAAYALASLAKPHPTVEDIEAIFKAVGASVEKEALAFTLESIANRDVNTLVAEGAAKMAAVPAAAGGAAPAAAAGGAAAPAAKKEEKVEEEADDDMGFGLFD